MLSREEARLLTDEIKNTTERLYELLLRAKEERAWEALGYPSWRLYVSTEFNMSKRHAYKILDLGEIIRTLSEESVLPNWANDHGLIMPNVHQAEELAQIKRQEGPQRMTEVWKETLDRTDGQPTAKAIRETVEACKPLPILEFVPVPFLWYKDQILKYVAQIQQQHNLTPIQAKALGEFLEALDRFMETATPEDNENYANDISRLT